MPHLVDESVVEAERGNPRERRTIGHAFRIPQDLRGLFAAVGYRGSDPIADGYLQLRSDGAGGTAIYFDLDGPGKAAATLITTVDAIKPPALTMQNDWFFQ